jgi:mono/diheme cytochrome c family protein
MKHLSAIITVFLSVLLGAGSIASGEKASVKEGKALFNDPELGSTGSSCNTCHTDGRGLEKATKKTKWIIGGKVHSTLEEAINYSIVTGLRGNTLNVGSVEMQSLVLYIKSLGGKKAVPPKKTPVSP